jgi:hypothetical protein
VSNVVDSALSAALRPSHLSPLPAMQHDLIEAADIRFLNLPITIRRPKNRRTSLDVVYRLT